MAWLKGKVSRFHPETHTYTVLAGGHILTGVQRLLDHPGDVVGLPEETVVALHDQLGLWVIAGVLNQARAGEFELAPVKVSDVAGTGADDPLAPEAIGDGRAYQAPRDIGPNDWARYGDVGQLLALLSGGAAVMRSSPLAQVRTFQHNDLVEVVSHLWRHITAMGQAEVRTDGPRVSYTWRGGANTDQTIASAESWTIRLDVGAAGSDIFALSITTPQGQTLARIAITPEGRLELRGTSLEVTAGSAGTTAETVVGDRAVAVGGTLAETVDGDHREVVAGVRSVQVSLDDDQVVGGALNQTVNGAQHTFIGGTVNRKVMGGTLPTPGALAEVQEYVNGGVETVVGSPTSGALPAAQQGASWVNYIGGFHFVVQPGALPAPLGGFNVLSALPGSVNLGCDGVATPNPTGGHTVVAVPAPFGVMKYEPWVILMQVLVTWLGTHTHPTPSGMSSAPAILPDPLVLPLLAPIRSSRVGVGL